MTKKNKNLFKHFLHFVIINFGKTDEKMNSLKNRLDLDFRFNEKPLRKYFLVQIFLSIFF